jgi:hypothetical protein
VRGAGFHRACVVCLYTVYGGKLLMAREDRLSGGFPVTRNGPCYEARIGLKTR